MIARDASLRLPDEVFRRGDGSGSLKARILTLQLSIAMLEHDVPPLQTLSWRLGVSAFHLSHIQRGVPSATSVEDLERALSVVSLMPRATAPSERCIAHRKQALFTLLQEDSYFYSPGNKYDQRYLGSQDPHFEAVYRHGGAQDPHLPEACPTL